MSSLSDTAELQATSEVCNRPPANPVVANSSPFIKSRKHRKVSIDTSSPPMNSDHSLPNTNCLNPQSVPESYPSSPFRNEQVFAASETVHGPSQYRTGSLSDMCTLPTSPILLFPKKRPGRKFWTSPLDPQPQTCYDDSIRSKPKHAFRLFFQNIKGLSLSNGSDDYKYYLSSFKTFGIDIAGLAETNTAWQHYHLQQDLKYTIRREFRQSKVVFGSPTTAVDKCAQTETFQSGGNMSFLHGPLTSSVYGPPILDDTGLGRWTGFTLRGQNEIFLSIITAYRTCGGNIRTASLGSTFTREYHFFSDQGYPKPNPRQLFFDQIGSKIQDLQDKGHHIILMMDANSDLTSDHHFLEFTSRCNFHDLHSHDPSPSTYIGSPSRRIDYMLGCGKIKEYMHRAGTLSYVDGPQSDHRGLFVDLQIPGFSRYLTPQLMSPAAHRSLHTGNPELVSAYLSFIKGYYEQHHMQHRIEDLYQRHQSMPRSEVETLLIRWDNDQGRAFAHAERKLSKPPKKCSWSPALRNSALIRRYWKLRLTEVKHNKNYQATFERWQFRIQQTDPDFRFPFMCEHLSILEIRRHFNAATKTFRSAQHDATQLRLQSYENLILKYLSDCESATYIESQRKAKVLLRTIQTETCRKTFNQIHRTLRPVSESGLSTLMIPKSTLGPGDNDLHDIIRRTPADELTWETVIDRSDIEKHLLSFNREAFRAAAASPCGHGIIHDAITFTSLSPEAKELLSGVVPDDWGVDDQVLLEFLASFAMPKSVIESPPISTAISEEDVSRGFRSWRETTTTSPSGRHLGHYKSIIQDTMLLRCFTQFLNIALFHGIAIPRWRNATNVMLEKDPASPRINRLRIIHLFEADYNFILKILWGSRLVQRALEFDLLHDGQFGSVPRRTTLDPIMLTQLTSDLSRILKMNMARFDNDASACYDRIIVALGMLAARRCGMPENAISTHATALQFMRYTVKTIYGISQDSYSGSEFEPLFGTGQGSGASPSVWLTLVVLLLHTLEKLVPDRCSFESPSSKLTHHRLVDAFVDDTSISITDSNSEWDLEELILRLQSAAQTWEHLLSLSGGALNLSKCSWYAVYWEWDKGRPKFRQILPTDPKLTLYTKLGSSDAQTIPRMPLEHSARVLGVRLSPSGRFSDHIQVYKQKADTFAARLISPRIGATEARIFHRSIYVPSMRYGLASVSADEEELNCIQTRILASILQKMKVSRTLPTSIRHGPYELGGLDLYDLRTELGIEMIKFMRDAIFSNSSAGRMLVLNLQYLQLEAGIGPSILENPAIPLSYLTPSWLVSVRKFLAKHNMSITLTDQPTLQLSGLKDHFVMSPQHLSRYSKIQQYDINLVRLFLQVNTLADMTDPKTPNQIRPEYLDAKRPLGLASSYNWPRQASPTIAQRKLWKRFLVSSYMRYVPYWKEAPLTSQSPIRGSALVETSIPLDTPSPTSMPLSDYLKILPRSQRRMLSDVEQIATDIQVWRAFRSREQLYIASDGGLSGNQGTFGWVLTTSKHVLFQCGGPVDGPFDVLNSTRSELCGFASSLLMIAAISRNWGLRHRCSFRWCTDSKSALSKVFKTNQRGCTSGRQPYDSDLLSMIRSLLIEIRRHVSFKWVKGHQDSLRSYDTLPRIARLNIDADFLATRYRQRGRLKSSCHVEHHPAQKISIAINGIRLTSQYDSCIRYHINGYHLKRYMQAHRGWSDPIWEKIDFGLFGKHFRLLSPSQQVSHMKLVHDQLPLGSRMFQRSEHKDPILKNCPCCGSADETSGHFLRCKANTAQDSGLSLLLKDPKGVAHPLRKLLVEGIRHWIDNGNSDYNPSIDDFPLHMHDSIQAVILTQGQIGWDNALRGFLSKFWYDLALLSYEGDAVPINEGSRRMRSCIRSLYDLTSSLWKARNTALHESDAKDQTQRQSALAGKIKFFHTQSDNMCFDDRYLCEMPLSALLNASPSTQRRWLDRVRKSKESFSRLGERQTQITSFFRRVEK
jgi:hypothetical protein